ncbi:hypothetical protein C0995_001706 [Termitomyces sp. Mi166|nr:hypothetical protein C0995_001706 [Termitomyces sp. Mi166\
MTLGFITKQGDVNKQTIVDADKGKAWAIEENNEMEVDPATIPLLAEADMVGNAEGKPEEQELMDYPNSPKPPAAKSK